MPIYRAIHGQQIITLVINEYLERLIERLQIIDDSAQFSIHCDTSPLADRYMAYLAGLGFTERTTVLSALNGVLMSLLVRFNNTRTQTKCPS